MCKTDISFFINDTIEGHATQLEKIYLLAIHPCNTMIGVGQSYERDLLIRPVLFERRW